MLHYQVALPFLDKVSDLHLCLLLTGHHLALHGRWMHVAEIISGGGSQIILGRFLVREFARSLGLGPVISCTSRFGLGCSRVGRKWGSISSSKAIWRAETTRLARTILRTRLRPSLTLPSTAIAISWSACVPLLCQLVYRRLLHPDLSQLLVWSHRWLLFLLCLFIIILWVRIVSLKLSRSFWIFVIIVKYWVLILNLDFLTINYNRGHLVWWEVLNELGAWFCIVSPKVDLSGLLLRLVIHLICFVSNIPNDTAIVLIKESAILLDSFSLLFGSPLPLLLHLHHGNQLFDFFFAQVLRPVLALPIFLTRKLYLSPTQLRCFNHWTLPALLSYVNQFTAQLLWYGDLSDLFLQHFFLRKDRPYLGAECLLLTQEHLHLPVNILANEESWRSRRYQPCLPLVGCTFNNFEETEAKHAVGWGLLMTLPKNKRSWVDIFLLWGMAMTS